MTLSRRQFSRTAGLIAGSLVAVPADAQTRDDARREVPDVIRALSPLPGAPPYITDDERRARIGKARRLMAEQGLGAIVLEPGTTMAYFVDVRWGLSERPFLLVIPARGELAYVAPAFEENRAREITKFTNDVRVWQEDEDATALVAGILKERGVATGKVGLEERVRFFIVDGLRKAAPAIEWTLATPVTAGCRMIKSATEIALMQHANDITIAAYKAGLSTLHEGLTQNELRDNITAAYRALGASGPIDVSFGEYTAFPHGSVQPQRLKSGDVVQIDDGVSFGGYQSDITRTVVFGTPSKRQVDVWNLEKKAQAAAFAAARVGATCESVDAAARKVISDAGFGPGYKVPGLPHRTGHGIGMDGHEWTNFVKGNTTRLAPGMCFSDEPMIAIYGEFGIRLEDCLYITPDGPKFFTQPSPAIDQPFAS
ncbi:Xaa-Pro dipeptidase [Luteitalea pratensis]|uniref:Xaa-Pro dipeptidase n=1 Tax=Luteitalea pratensis TaxID=1855912 RepID=A0A143PK53_LUTPR|nr:Xaa-Pro peptidase family protein [Luteitalea pratensis]AMY08154.1 Xaa-Pro dipeptidase [Luteitalea pratensis]